MLVSPLGRHFESLRPRQRSKSNVIGIVQRLVLGPGSFARHLSFFFSFFVCLVSHLECLGSIFGGFAYRSISLRLLRFFFLHLPPWKNKKMLFSQQPQGISRPGPGYLSSHGSIACSYTHTHTLGTENVSTTKETKTKTTGWPFFFLGNCCALDLREKRMNDLITFGYAPIEEKRKENEKNPRCELWPVWLT